MKVNLIGDISNLNVHIMCDVVFGCDFFAAQIDTSSAIPTDIQILIKEVNTRFLEPTDWYTKIQITKALLYNS